MDSRPPPIGNSWIRPCGRYSIQLALALWGEGIEGASVALSKETMHLKDMVGRRGILHLDKKYERAKPKKSKSEIQLVFGYMTLFCPRVW